MSKYALIFTISMSLIGCSSGFSVSRSDSNYLERLDALVRIGQDISALSSFRPSEVVQGTRGSVCHGYAAPENPMFARYVIFVNSRVESWKSFGGCDELLRQNGYSREVQPGGTANDVTIRQR